MAPCSGAADGGRNDDADDDRSDVGRDQAPTQAPRVGSNRVARRFRKRFDRMLHRAGRTASNRLLDLVSFIRLSAHSRLISSPIGPRGGLPTS